MLYLALWFVLTLQAVPPSPGQGALPAAAQTAQGTTDLEAAVAAYWDLLQKQDKAGALRYVHPDDLNHFIRRTEGSFSDWKVISIEQPTPDSARVTVSIQRLMMNSRVPQEITETWERTDSGWKVRVPQPVPIVERVRARARELASRRMPETLEVFPPQLRFYALSPRQPAAITIRNGLHEPVKVVGLEFDPQRLRVASPVEVVAARSSGRILMELAEVPDQANVPSEVELRLQVGEELRTFQIPVVINYVDDITRWVAGQARPHR